MARRTDTIRNQGLFPSEAAIARHLSQTPAEWAAKAKVLERDGLPAIDPLMGGHPLRAVIAFFDRRSGLSSIEPLRQPDGEENLDAL